MPNFRPEPPVAYDAQNRTAVLLMNLGTPAAPAARAVRPYLKDFLSDPRVVELPRLLWQPLLRGLILPFRARQSAHGYRKIWLPSGSPLAVYTEKIAAALARNLPGITVRHAMTYGTPAVCDVLADLKKQGVTRLMVLPLYPQYAASSSAAALDKVFAELQKQRNMMAVRTMRGFAGHAGYIESLRRLISDYWQANGRGQKLLMSFHGIPEAQYRQGDPYPDECRRTAALLAAALGLHENDYLVAFQSQFGRAKWVGPSTQTLLAALPARGVEKLDVVCPAFVADCLETAEEIALAGREQFHAAGGTQFHYIPCLNDRADWIAALTDIVRAELGNWLPEAGSRSGRPSE
ncbi:ferrochelatase [Neisseria leonii]|uniref:ferrochelatase n=1 Tax=Neisseria leonii TaxID=2995413 RepID=UPI00237AFDCA|nr:ferrochelatase [Neisseria sp. 3986]MDD9326435.1 ferrochelatase [Neisseria sp. 3986]